MAPQYKHLTDEQIENFTKYGWLKIPEAFTPEKSHQFTKDVWQRLGYDPNDRKTCKEERINMPSHYYEAVQTFAPKAWATMRELLGWEDGVGNNACTWNDGSIVSLGLDEWEGKWQDPRDLTNQHVDSDFFVHFLDSPEQGLLVMPLFTDIKPRAGGL